MVDVQTDVVQAIEDLRSELRALSERLAKVESAKSDPLAAPVAIKAPPAASKEVPVEPVSEETLLLISAAVAAFLGERAHIRQVRLISSGGWALQGRVFIQASHNLGR